MIYVVVDIKIYYKPKYQTSAFKKAQNFLKLFNLILCLKIQKNQSPQMLQIFLLSLEIKRHHKISNNRKPLKKFLKKNKTITLKANNKFMIMICKANQSWKLKNFLVILPQNIHLKLKNQKVQIKIKTKNKLPLKKQKSIKKISKKSCRQNQFLKKVKSLKKRKLWSNNNKKKFKSNKSQFNKSRGKLFHSKEFYL